MVMMLARMTLLICGVLLLSAPLIALPTLATSLLICVVIVLGLAVTRLAPGQRAERHPDDPERKADGA